MGLFDLISKTQKSIDNAHKKVQKWQTKVNYASDTLGKSAVTSSASSSDETELVPENFTCAVCGNHNENGKKKTVYGEICSNCVQRLKNRGLSHRSAKKLTHDQFFALCDDSLNALERVKPFILPKTPIALKDEEQCYYAGDACGAKMKTLTTGYTGRHKGYSVRLMKNLSYHSGGSAEKAVRQQVLESSPLGTFVITSQRFILLTPMYGFEILAGKVGYIETRPDGLALYAGNKNYIVLSKDIDYIALIITLLSEATAEYKRKNEVEKSVRKTTRSTKIKDNARFSAADEIRKYRQLADEGIIAAEEFEKKKKELLES